MFFLKTIRLAAIMSMVLLFMACGIAAGAPVSSPGMSQESYMPENIRPNGELEVYLLESSRWTKVGSLPFDKYLREGSINLEGFITTSQTVKVRLAKKGGGSAHLDSVFLGGSLPAAAYGGQGDTLGKLSQKDNDVIGVGGAGIEIEFPQGAKSKVLSVTARTESESISQIPFHFPLENTYTQITKDSSFYPYRLGSVTGKLLINGDIDEVDRQVPFIKEYVVPGSGHPPGYTYGWVMNDEQNLYVAMDFTPDNTMDGNKDYAKVYVKTDVGIKEYKVSVPEVQWGRPGFVYTDKAGYQHKVYEFAIPLNEISPIRGVQEIQLAFAAYGTATPGDRVPVLAYDPDGNRFLSVFEKIGDGIGLYGEFISAQGTPGGSFLIGGMNYFGTLTDEPASVVYGVYNNSVPCYLAVWENNIYDENVGSMDFIVGQFIDASNGLPIGNAMKISDTDAIPSGLHPSVAYDSVNQRFLVVWEDYRFLDPNPRTHVIFGQLINSDGSLNEGNFAICDNSSGEQYDPFVAYDSSHEKYLVVWQDYRSFNYNDIYGQIVNSDATLFGTASNLNFAVSNAEVNKYNPVISFDSTNNKFLVVWEQGVPGSENIYGQFLDAELNFYLTAQDVNFPISTAAGQQTNPAVAFDEIDNRFMVVWSDNRNSIYTGEDIYGQLVSAGGSLYPDPGESTANMAIAAGTSGETGPWTSFNGQDNNFLVGFTNADSYPIYLSYTIIPPTPPMEFTVNNYNVGSDPYAITAGDLNRDGSTDLIVSDKTDGNGGFSVFMGNGDGTFAESVFNGPFGMVFWPAVGLFDGDAHLDLAVTSPYAGLLLFKGTGSGTFSAEPYATYYNSGLNSVVTGDFDGSGLIDLAVSNANNKVLFYFNNGDGTFGAAGSPNREVDIRMPTRMAAGDINNDGATDLAVMYDDYWDGDSVYILINDGAGNFSWTDNFPSGPDSLWVSNDITIGDADGDGNDDLLVANMSQSNPIGPGRASVFRGGGDGTFDTMTHLATGGGPVGIAVKDFNGDGNNDVAVANRYSGKVSVLCGNGLGGFAAKQDFSVGSSPFYMVAGDFNNDTEMDLAVVNNDSNGISVLLSSAAIPDAQAPSWTGGSLTVSEITADSLKLTWTDSATDNVSVTGYKIYRDGTPLGGEVVDFNTRSANITSLSESTQYTFKVEAGDTAGNWSDNGPSVTVTTASGVGGGGGPVPQALSKTPEGTGMTYTVTIPAGAVNSADGVPLAEDYTFTFTVQVPEAPLD